MTFRSQDMGHYQMIISRQNAYNVISDLSMYDITHIIDNGDYLNRPFYPQIKRCEQSLSKIDAIIQRLHKEKIKFQQYDQNEKLFIQKLHYLWNQDTRKLGMAQIKILDKVQQDIHMEYKRFRDLDQRLQKIKSNRKELLQKIACYETIQSFLGQSYFKRQSQEYYMNNIGSGAEEMSGVSYMVGVIETTAILRLSKMIYRVSRGYACIKEMDAYRFEPLRELQEKIVLIIYPTSRTSVLQKKIQRVVETFCHNYFLFSKIEQNIKLTLQRLIKQYSQVIDMIDLNEKQIKSFLTTIKKIKYLQSWRIFLWKEKLIYQTLNKFELRGEFICGEIYVPTNKIEKLSLSLTRMVPSPTLHVLELGKPPTAFDTNTYTMIPQQITNTYGVPRYKQVNPSILTTVTFPFFFGVMFGDIAHGCALLIFGIYLVFFNEQVKRSALKVFSDLRYMILMMGFFAFYCGWIYNDFMGMNMNFFGSCYKLEPMPEEAESITKQIIPEEPDCIYPFGIDPAWGRSKNNLQFVNSLKMKISVIIAIVHMAVGVIIKAFNSKFFKRTLDFYFEFIPQFIFLVLLFGYMDFLIVFKWLKNWGETTPRKQWIPSIITTMMNIGLKMGQTSQIADGGSSMWGPTGHTSQDTIQFIIFFIGFLCVPWMLLPKPIIEIKKINKHKQKKNPLLGEYEENLDSDMNLVKNLNQSGNSSHDDKGDEHGEANEIFVHQLIETIQFVLGAISNTASYLRLWALSLAHSQLALVFFQKTLENGYTGQSSFLTPVIMVMGFYMLIWVTFGILMCMDSMQCFLHSLRLHWVEFQNKFYKGDGYKYVPLSLKNYILEKKKQSES